MIYMTAMAFLAVWKFYVTAAFCIVVYRLWLKGSLNIYNKLLFAPVIIPFYLSDVFFNFTLLNLAFGMTPTGTKSISERFEYYRKVKAPSEFAKSIADFTCDKLLNTVDPTENHC